MTFLEKRKRDFESKNLNEIGCPRYYGYEDKEQECCGDCVECWNREIPATKSEETPTLPSEEFIEPKCTFETEVKNAYNKGLNDAWELARKIGLAESHGGIGYEKLKKIFGTDCYGEIMSLTPQEALAKLKAYEDSKIEVGDMVFNHREQIKGLVLDVDNADPCVWVLTENECVEEWDMCDIKKTDKHISIARLINRIREV